jgi:Protein of unknown function (DUF3349)
MERMPVANPPALTARNCIATRPRATAGLYVTGSTTRYQEIAKVGLAALITGVCECMTINVSLSNLVARMVGFVRAGYPQQFPETDYITPLALLRRRLTDDEVAAVAIRLAVRDELSVDTADIGVAITRITDELPAPTDIRRVQHRLEASGWFCDSDG